MSTVTYTASREADEKHAHAILQVDGSISIFHLIAAESCRRLALVLTRI